MIAIIRFALLTMTIEPMQNAQGPFCPMQTAHAHLNSVCIGVCPMLWWAGTSMESACHVSMAHETLK